MADTEIMPHAGLEKLASSEQAEGKPEYLDHSQTQESSNRAAARSAKAGFGSKGQRRKRDTGRAEWSRKSGDKRARNEQTQRAPKRRRVGADENNLPIYATKYSAEEIAAQERRPKRKVAVLIGYSGSGYKGMQVNNQEKTIEGDLFKAFVAAGAISKANADDTKKSSLVRCARTDKGVHAAGNIISLKLVVEDEGEDIVTKINEHLPPQIRVWGIQQTNGGFSSYQACDSRIYEYLIPTHCFLPPHPQSFLGQQVIALADEENDLEGYERRQSEVANFWSETEERHIKPVVETIDPSIRDEVLARFKNLGYLSNDPFTSGTHAKVESDKTQPKGDASADLPGASANDGATDSSKAKPINPAVEEGVRALKSVQIAAKRAWRLPQARLDRIRSILSRFVGSIKYHNYTVDKQWRDPSAIRVIKSFTVDEKPILIGGTEWLSLKVHGQSFMMHQIRKMVCAAALIVRCGCHEGRLQDTFLRDRLSIPKAPSLGLLLERPVFDKYNERLVELSREPIDFAKHEQLIAEFKQREIYEKMFQLEEKEAVFPSFFSGLDCTRSASLLWVTSAGLRGTQKDVPEAHNEESSNVPTNVKDVEEEDELEGQDEN